MSLTVRCMAPPIAIYVHGCSLAPSWHGGWGVVLRQGIRECLRAGECRSCHAPRMQVHAVAEALRAVFSLGWHADEIVIHTTSGYVVDNVPRLDRWHREGRLNPHGLRQVKNADLWAQVALRLHRLPTTRCVLLGKRQDLDQQRARGLARGRASRLASTSG